MNKYQILKYLILGKTLTPRRVFNLGINYIQFLAKNPKIIGPPSILQIEPTNFCNLSCPLCPTGNKTLKAPQGFMNLENYKKIIDEVGNYLLNITLYNYGEPFLNKSIYDMIEYTKKKRIFIRISTNGHFFNDEKNIKRLVQSNMDHLIIALDGASQETFSKYRKNGNFNLVLNNIKKLIEEKRKIRKKTPFIEILFVVMKHNEHEVPLMRKIAKEIGADHLCIKSANLGHEIPPDIEEAKSYLPETKEFQRYNLKDDKLVKKTKAKSCVRLWIYSVINWDGAVVPCCFDPNRQFYLGNIFEEVSFSKIWKSQKYSDFRKAIMHNKDSFKMCKDCSGKLKPEEIE